MVLRKCLLYITLLASFNPLESSEVRVAEAATSGGSDHSELRVERVIHATPERAFRAWVDPQAVHFWFAYNAPVYWDADPQIAAKAGGRLTWKVRGDDKSVYLFTGKYFEVASPHDLAFTWHWDSLPIAGIEGSGNTRVHVQFLPEGGGATRIVLTQSGLPSEAARASHEIGWKRCLEGLEELLVERGYPGERQLDSSVIIRDSLFALTHVSLIDGTGAVARRDQTIVVKDGTIAAIGNAASVVIPKRARRLDYSGSTAMPGLVGMHDHLFYSVDYFSDGGDKLAHDMPYSYPRLYLASGVTTIRTTGSFEPYTDLEIKKAVETGRTPGPKMNVTGPYLEGSPFPLIQIHKLEGSDDVTRTVDYWAAEGVGSFKVYTDISHADLAVAIKAAHRHGITVTGHLCSVGFREAAELGIDGLEHGLWTDTEFVPSKQPDICPSQANATAADLEIESEPIQRTIRTLVEHGVAVTSTLPVWEEFIPTSPDASQRVLDALNPDARARYLQNRKEKLAILTEHPSSPEAQELERFTRMLPREMRFERAFVQAGGLLVAGPDGVIGGDIAGYGDQREIELLVEAGFTVEKAVQIATLNGAHFLGLSWRIGSLEVGKRADIVVVKGNPAERVADIENVQIVFKDGFGYDPAPLIESVRGHVGTR